MCGRKNIFKYFLLAGLLLTDAAVADETDIDITAFGDTGFISGNKLLGNDNNHLIRPHLKGLEALRSKDINLINLEATLTNECRKMADKQFAFVMTPQALAEYLKWGVNFIGLANNHSIDCVEPYPFSGIDGIIKSLQKQYPNSRFHGVAKNASALVRNPASRTVRGVSVGMVSIKAWDNGAWAPLGNTANRLRVFSKLKTLPHDVRILSLHGGVESTRQPGLVVSEIAREFINDYEGDVVFAHHPHLMQGVEVVKKKNGRIGVIFYSLGNGLHNGLSMNGDGMAAKLLVGKNGVRQDSIRIYPLKFASFNPRPFKQHELASALAEVESSIKLIPADKNPSHASRLPVKLKPITIPALGAEVQVAK